MFCVDNFSFSTVVCYFCLFFRVGCWRLNNVIENTTRDKVWKCCVHLLSSKKMSTNEILQSPSNILFNLKIFKNISRILQNKNLYFHENDLVAMFLAIYWGVIDKEFFAQVWFVHENGVEMGWRETFSPANQSVNPFHETRDHFEYLLHNKSTTKRTSVRFNQH